VQTGRTPSHLDFLFRQATQAPSVTVRFGFWTSNGLLCGGGGAASSSNGAGCSARKLAMLRRSSGCRVTGAALEEKERDDNGHLQTLKMARESDEMIW
jgi:hypothetical protein